jgi:hypothetical protein
MASKRKLTKSEINRLTKAVSFDQYTRAHATTNTYHTCYFGGVWTRSAIMSNIMLEIGVIEVAAGHFVGTGHVLSSQGYQWLSDNGYLADFEEWANLLADNNEAIEYLEYRIRDAHQHLEFSLLSISVNQSKSLYQWLAEKWTQIILECETELATLKAG